MKLNGLNPIKEVKEKEDKDEEDKDEEGKEINEKSKEKGNIISDKIYKEKKISTEKEIQIQKEKDKEELNLIIKLLKIEKDNRIKTDIIRIKDYLCSHIDYFKRLLEQSEDKLLKLIYSLNYEFFKTNERIMNFGEDGDKCYILLKGRVGIYKPFPITKQMTLRDYVEFLVDIRDNERNIPKFDRILNYNSKIDKVKLFAIDFDYTKIPQTYNNLSIVAEEERELAQASSGNLFGEMALIKNEPRNASIIALENCDMISIEKIDYAKIVRDMEEQRVNKELASFKRDYPIFLYWQPSKCIRLLSGFIKEEYDKDDYVYKQNDVPAAIYLIKEGIFEVISYFNFNWYEKFINYIHDTSESFFNDIDNPMIWKEDKITKKINDAYKDKSSPFILKRNPIDKVITSNHEFNDENGDMTKEVDEEISHNKNLIFKANIQKLESPNYFGFLEILELKHRICSVKCISQKGVLMKFPLLEFLQLIPTDKRNQFYLQERIFKEKKKIITQLKNTILTKLNFLKKEENNNYFLSKHFFNNNNIKRNIKKLDFKRNFIDNNLTPLINLKLRNGIDSMPKLNKSKSTLYYNISRKKKKELILSSNDYNINKIDNEKKNNYKDNSDNSFEVKRPNPKNGIIFGFKNSVIKLTKNKMKIFKGIFQNETDKKKVPLSLNIKQINNSNKEYIKYLENNIDLNITPTKLRNINIENRMTGKKYMSLEASKIIYRLNKSNEKTKSTNESRIDSKIILPYINNVRSPKNNKENY